MARTLTNLTPTLYSALDVVSRELVGLIPAVSSDMTHARAAIGETVYSPATAALAAGDITPAVTPPDDGDNTLVGVPLTITKARRVPVRINGEQQLTLQHGAGWNQALTAEFAQAMRTLVNEVEADLAALYIHASRAYGSAGTTPFGATPALSDGAYLQKILDDNGAPLADRQLVINTAAAANLASLTQLTNVNQAGEADLLRRGVLGDLFGFQMRKSAQIKTHTPGTAAAGTGYLVDLTAGYAVGSTAIHLDTGTGTHVAGDVLSNTQSGRDGNKYVIATGATGDGDKDIVLAAPGLRAAWTNNDTVAIAAAYSANMAFSRSAIYLATRAPAVPAEGDAAADAMTLSDPTSGLTFEVREYRQYRQVQYEVSLAWGVACVKPAHLALLLG